MSKFSRFKRPKNRSYWTMLLMLLCLIILLSPVSMLKAEDTPDDIPASYQMRAENEQFQLFVDDETLAFKLLDKRSDYLWHSGLDEIMEGDRLNSSWQAFAKSGISIEYLDNRASSSRVSITNATHTLEMSNIEQGISARVTFDDFGISVGINLQLGAEGVRVEIPSDGIREDNPDFRLAKVLVYPFLGATRGGSVPGYMFLPDGIGSLIHYADTTRARNMFIGRYYGSDLGMIGFQPYDDEIIAPQPITFPVFGAVHGEGQNAFLSVVENGAPYGEVQMHPSGIITNFNFIYNAFVYNQTYFQATNRSGAGVTTVQRNTNRFDAVLHYRFLTGDAADYVGMARSYQDYLLDHHQLRSNEITNPNMGIRLEFLGGDKEQVIAWDRFVSMTTIEEVGNILDGLQIPNAEVIYYGWQPLGASTVPPTSLQIEANLGSLHELNALAQHIVSDGGHFSLYLDPQVALWREKGYSPRTDLAMAITNVAIEGYGRDYYQYFTLNTLENRYARFTSNLSSRLDAGLALDSIGSTLFSDFRKDNPLDREGSLEAYHTLLDESPIRLTFYRPNDYFYGLAEAYFDMPSGDNGYIFTSETVPFLPIVLSGHIPYYGTALNFSSNMEEDLLRHVEYGMYPSYFLTEEPTANVINTGSWWIYTSSNAQWGEQVRTSYQWMNTLLSPVRGQEIVEHERLAEGVYATIYANDRQIIVNYTEHPIMVGDSVVAAKDALVLEHGR